MLMEQLPPMQFTLLDNLLPQVVSTQPPKKLFVSEDNTRLLTPAPISVVWLKQMYQNGRLVL
jgi:hypothetical protein